MKLEHGARCPTASILIDRLGNGENTHDTNSSPDSRVCYAVSHMFINNKFYEICEVAVRRNSLTQIPKWIKFGIKTNFR